MNDKQGYLCTLLFALMKVRFATVALEGAAEAANGLPDGAAEGAG